jgi:hypothetical protein
MQKAARLLEQSSGGEPKPVSPDLVQKDYTMSITVCSAEYDLSEYDYSELIDLHSQFVDNAAALVERSEAWTVTVWEKSRPSYEKAMSDYNAGIVAVTHRIEELEKEAVNAAPAPSAQLELLTPCWWYGCTVLVEPDNAYCSKHRLLSADLQLSVA